MSPRFKKFHPGILNKETSKWTCCENEGTEMGCENSK
jgi:hypothetical protein